MSEKRDGTVIGIDGGGTHTRVMIADLSGRVLSYIQSGSSSIYKDLRAKENMQQAMKEALERARVNPAEVKMLAAGVAGLDTESDYEWVQPLTSLNGLACPRKHVNDAVVAHYGAFLAEPGIVSISGTGSIIYARTETGREIKNYDLHHYAASAARSLAMEATFELLAGNSDDSDSGLTRDILHFWKASNVQELSLLALQGFIKEPLERNRKFAELAPFVTKAAMQHSRLARRVCDRAIRQITVGTELLASYFSEPEVSVTFMGSVAQSDYFQQQLTAAMARGNNKKYRLVQPAFTPVAGAVLLAYRELGIEITPQILSNLSYACKT